MSNTATAPLPESDIEIEEHEALDQDYVLTPAFVEKVVDAADDGDGLRLRGLLEDLHPADVADLMGFLTAEHRAVTVLWLPPDLLAEIRRRLPALEPGSVGQLARQVMLGEQWLKHSADYPVYVPRLVHRRGPRFEMRGHGDTLAVAPGAAVVSPLSVSTYARKIFRIYVDIKEEGS